MVVGAPTDTAQIASGSMGTRTASFAQRDSTRSTFAVALSLFLLINLGLALSLPPVQVDPFSLPASPSFDFHRANSYRNEWHLFHKSPDIVLFGSSLMMIPQAAAEADYLGKAVDPVVNPYSTLLGDSIHTREHNLSPICFNFALPGGMISDHYMIVRTLFTPDSSPKVAVLGITLRDFIDNGVESAASTPAFNYLSRFVNQQERKELMMQAMPQLNQRGEYYLNSALYLYGNRIPLQVVGRNTAAQLAKDILPESIDKPAETSQTTNLSLDPEALFKGLEVLPGAFFIQPNSTIVWRDNSREYRKRFKTPHLSLFETEKRFLKMTLRELEKRGVRVLIVNMPLTEGNKKLMPPGSYERYLKFLDSLEVKGKVHLLNLDNGKFENTDFMDTAHMNANGGKKLIAAIAKELSSWELF